MTIVTERPTTISAKDFVEQGYAAKIANGECFVMRNKDEQIITIRKSNFDNCPIEVIRPYDAGIYESASIDEATYTVNWLPSAPVPATAGGEGVTPYEKGQRVLWIPHNHTGYISEVDERDDGLPCYYIELDMSDETGYAKHESLKIVGEDVRMYPREISEVEHLRARVAALEAERSAAGLLVTALTEIGKGYYYLHKYNAPDHPETSGEKLSGEQWSNYEGFSNFISRVATATLAAYAAAAGDNGAAA